MIIVKICLLMFVIAFLLINVSCILAKNKYDDNFELYLLNKIQE